MRLALNEMPSLKFIEIVSTNLAATGPRKYAAGTPLGKVLLHDPVKVGRWCAQDSDHGRQVLVAGTCATPACPAAIKH